MRRVWQREESSQEGPGRLQAMVSLVRSTGRVLTS